MKINFLIILLASFLVLSGCSLNQNVALPNIDQPLATVQKIATQQEDLLVTKIVSHTYTAQIEYDAQAKFISEWKNSNASEEIVINGGYFNEDYSPSGFLVVRGKRIGENMFDQDKTGMIVVTNGQISIRDLETRPIKGRESFEFALQTYPFLIKNGKPALDEDSGKTARRTMLGMDKENNVYIILSLSEVSLYEVMKKVVDLDIAFSNVINLDGGPSTSIYKNWNGESFWHEGYSQVPSIIRLTKSK